MSEVSGQLRRLIVKRAKGRCQYCGLSQDGQEATFHIDHILPKISEGPTVSDNLALVCVSCSLRKEARRSAPDLATGRKIPLFHPRRQRWTDHFRWDGVMVVGLTPTGRATISASRMNRTSILAIRQEETARGRHPPPGQGRNPSD